jgi:GT2 family glycosyltransferase
MNAPVVSIVIVGWECRSYLEACLHSLAAQPDPGGCEILVVDNASQDGTAEMVRASFPSVRLVVNPRNLGFAAGNNVGIRAAAGRYCLLLNPDTIVHPGALAALVAYAEAHPEAWAVGPRILNTDGTPQRSGVRFPSAWNLVVEALFLDRLFPRTRCFGSHRALYADPDRPRGVEYLQGSCLLLRADAIRRVGLLDESFFLYFEETDWCYRCRRAGGQVHYAPAATVTHHGGSGDSHYGERKLLLYHESLLRFCRKHYAPRRRAAIRAALAFRALLRLAHWSLLALPAIPGRTRARSSVRGYAGVLGRVLGSGPA